MFNLKRPKYHGNQLPSLLDLLRRPRVAICIGLVGYKYVERKLNDLSIDKGQ